MRPETNWASRVLRRELVLEALPGKALHRDGWIRGDFLGPSYPSTVRASRLPVLDHRFCPVRVD